MGRSEHAVPKSADEREVVPEHRGAVRRVVADESAPSHDARRPVEAEPFPHHRTGDGARVEVPCADVRHVSVVTREVVGIRHEALRQELLAHFGARIRREALHDREVEAEVAKLETSFDATNIALRTVDVPARKSDIAVGEVALVWTPWRTGADGFPAPAYD